MKYLSLFFIVAGFVTSANAQNQLKHELRTNGPMTQEAFSPLEQSLFDSSAVFYDESFMNGRRPAFLGTVVSSDGHIFTKASELQDDGVYKVRIGKTLYKDVKVLKKNDEWDLALVKVPAEGLKGSRFAESSSIENGTWLVTNGPPTRRRRKVRVGVLSAKPRMIEPAPASLGIHLDETKNELIISEVLETGGALTAGLLVGDKILKIADADISSPKELVDSFKDLEAGEVVNVTVARTAEGAEEEEEFSYDVELKSITEIYGDKPMDRNDSMSGKFSTRRHDFPRVIQHSIYATPRSIGGPVLLLDGTCIGMNIARADRVTTFAIPVEELQMLIKKMIESDESP